MKCTQLLGDVYLSRWWQWWR